MRIVHSSFSGHYVRIVAQFDNKEQIVTFGPFAPPLSHQPVIKDPLAAIDVEIAVTEIVKQTGRPEDDVRRAIARHLIGQRFTTPEDWYERFKAAGGRGRVDVEKVWFSESGPLPSAAVEVIDDILGPGKEDAYRQVVAYMQALHHGFVGWADF